MKSKVQRVIVALAIHHNGKCLCHLCIVLFIFSEFSVQVVGQGSLALGRTVDRWIDQWGIRQWLSGISLRFPIGMGRIVMGLHARGIGRSAPVTVLALGSDGLALGMGNQDPFGIEGQKVLPNQGVWFHQTMYCKCSSEEFTQTHQAKQGNVGQLKFKS